MIMKDKGERLNRALIKISEAINNDRRLNHINAGGCGVFAAMIIKQFNLPSDSLQWINYRSIRNEFESDEIAGCYHVIVKINNYTSYDSTGLHSPRKYSYPITDINYKYLAKNLCCLGNWNTTFNRKKLTPIISAIVKAEAQKYYETID